MSVWYCSEACQRAARPKHKSLCKTLKAVREQAQFAIDAPHAGGLAGLREHIQQLSIAVRCVTGRALSGHDRWQCTAVKHCHECYRVDGHLSDCQRCQRVAFCEAHVGGDHQCTELLGSQQCDWIMMKEGHPPLYLPEEFTPRGLCSGQLCCCCYCC